MIGYYLADVIRKGETKMSLKFKIDDWKFEITWSGMVCTPIEKGEAESKTELNGRRSGHSVNRNAKTKSDSLFNLAQAKERKEIRNEFN